MVHEALIYRGTNHFGDVVSAYATEAAEAGEPVLAVLPQGSYELVQSAVHGSGAQTQFEDMSERGRNPTCLLDVFEDWIDAHDGPVRVIGEPVWPGRRQAEIVEVLRHEALINHVLASASISILCPYDGEHLAADVLEGAELTHPQLVSNGSRRPSPRYGDPLEVYAATRWPQPPGTEPISELDFSGDLRGLREAVTSDPVCGVLSGLRRADLVFVVNEAATNALRHGDGSCRVRLWREGDTVVSEVVTKSQLGDATTGRRRPAMDGSGGRGLWLINQLCDLVELRSGVGGTRLRMHLRDPAA
ncbi:MAG: sensor histidine kinase [Actinomycetota bacterium]|nr:sensor histidine kinase [Actinomycetota bacterium]